MSAGGLDHSFKVSTVDLRVYSEPWNIPREQTLARLKILLKEGNRDSGITHVVSGFSKIYASIGVSNWFLNIRTRVKHRV